MYTDPGHIRVADPGKVEGNVAFAYLDAFHPNKEEVAELKEQYQKGGLGDKIIKSLLNDTLQALITPIRERRDQLQKAELDSVLHQGTAAARKVAQATMQEVRTLMSLDY